MDKENLPFRGLPAGHFLHQIRIARYGWAVRIATASATAFQQQVILREDVGKKDAIRHTPWQSDVLELAGLGRSWQRGGTCNPPVAGGGDPRAFPACCGGTGSSPASHLCFSSP